MRQLKTTAAAAGFAVMILLGGCATNDSATINDDYGAIDPAATAAEGTTTPAVIAGPAKIDSEGRAYTSSAAGGTGNAAVLGTNTNVNLVPEEPVSTTSVTYIEPAPAPVIVETAPIIETPVVVVEETRTTTVVEVPMTSATVTEVQETTTRRRISKD
jgi:hypothetical protein